MKTKLRILQSLLVAILLFGGVMNGMAQTNPGGLPSSTTTQNVCQGKVEQYAVQGHLGTTYEWSIIANPDGGGTIASVNDSITNITWTTLGTCTLQLKESNATGCFSTSLMTVIINEAPVLVITNPLAICAPGTVDLTLAAVTAGSTLPTGTVLTYWTDALATVAVVDPTIVAASGTYYIKATTLAGCIDIQPVTVIIDAVPVLVITNPSAICAPGTVDLTAAAVTLGSTIPAGAVLTYWSDAAATLAVVDPTAVTVSGTYYIKATSLGGCSDIQPVDVTIEDVPVLVITDPTAICSPGTVDLTAAAVTVGSTLPASAALTYWTDAAATIAVLDPTAVAASGTYYIKAATTAGCSDIQPVIVTINPIPATSPIFHN